MGTSIELLLGYESNCQRKSHAYGVQLGMDTIAYRLLTGRTTGLCSSAVVVLVFAWHTFLYPYPVPGLSCTTPFVHGRKGRSTVTGRWIVTNYSVNGLRGQLGKP